MSLFIYACQLMLWLTINDCFILFIFFSFGFPISISSFVFQEFVKYERYFGEFIKLYLSQTCSYICQRIFKCGFTYVYSFLRNKLKSIKTKPSQIRATYIKTNHTKTKKKFSFHFDYFFPNSIQKSLILHRSTLVVLISLLKLISSEPVKRK